MLHMLNGNSKTTFKATHMPGTVKQLTCDEADCGARAMGFKIVLSLSAQQGAINYIRSGKTGRRFLEKSEDALFATFYFQEGQNCFETHWQRDPIFNIRRKDTGGRVITYPDGDAFIGDSDSHLRRIKEALNG